MTRSVSEIEAEINRQASTGWWDNTARQLAVELAAAVRAERERLWIQLVEAIVVQLPAATSHILRAERTAFASGLLTAWCLATEEEDETAARRAVGEALLFAPELQPGPAGSAPEAP